MTAGKKFLNLAFAPVILAMAVTVVAVLVKMKTKKPPKDPDLAVPLIEVVESSPGDVVPTISTYGNVRSYYETRIAGQVGGLIEKVDPKFEPGLAVGGGDVLVKIEDSDFRATVAERKSALAAAKQVLADEKARSDIAREDWLASGRNIRDATEFTLRTPQLTAAKAAVEAAEESVAKAELDVERTEIRAPFPAIVQARSASPGNVVAAGASLGVLISRDKAEVRLPLTPDQVARLDLPLAFIPGTNPSISATLRRPSQPGTEWLAEIKRTEAAIDSKNHVLYVIAEIDEPFEDAGSFLPIGAFVTAELDGKVIKQVYKLPESTLVNDDYIWVVDSDLELCRQPATRVFSENGELLVRIDEPVTSLPLKVVARPLASFSEGTVVIISEPTTDVETP